MVKAKAASAKKSKVTANTKSVASGRRPLRKLKLNQHQTVVLLEGFDGETPQEEAFVFSVLRNQNGVPTNSFVVWDEAKAKVLANGRKLQISGTPKKIALRPAVAGESVDADLIGDLNVTVQFPTTPSESVSVSTVTYSPPP